MGSEIHRQLCGYVPTIDTGTTIGEDATSDGTLVEHNMILEEIVWPACQQDESLVADEVGVAVMEVLESLSKN